MKRLETSAALYGAAILILAAFGLRYLFASSLAPHHAAALDLQQPLAAAQWAVFSGLYKTMAAAMLVIAGLLCVLVALPFRRGEAWARYCVTLGGGIFAAVVLFVMWQFQAATGIVAIPIVIAAALALLLILAAHFYAQAPATRLKGSRSLAVDE